MAVTVAGFMERMARLGLGIVRPNVGLSVLAQVLNSAWQPAAAQRALFVGAETLHHPLVAVSPAAEAR